MTKNKIISLLCPVSFLTFGIYIVISTAKMNATDSAFPRMVAYLIIAISIIQLFLDVKQEHNQDHFSGVNFAKVSLCLAVMFVYVFLLKKIGFIIDTLLLTAFTMYILEYRNIKGLVASSVMITAVIFAVFKLLLKVPLPTIWL